MVFMGPREISTQKIPLHQTPPWKISPGKLPPEVFPLISFVEFLYLTLRPNMGKEYTCTSSSLDEKIDISRTA